MTDEFKHYWTLTEAEKLDVWDNGIIVLDTNIYLHIYRFPSFERDQLLMILKNPKIQERLWVPHQVAEEFFRNRLNVISDQIAAAKKFLDTADKSLIDLFKSIDKVVRKHHPLINREDWKSSLKTTLDSLKGKYEEAKEAYPISVKNDLFLEEVMQIMKNRIGPAFSEEEMVANRKEAKTRFEMSIPPGYLDAKKDGDRPYGDFLLWKQCLAEMKIKRSHLILVVDDYKDDWWLRVQGQLLGPRPELRKEYREETSKEVDFVTAERFIEWAADHLNLEKQVSLEEAITEARTKGKFRFDFETVGHGSVIIPSYIGKEETKIEDISTPEEIAEWFLEIYEDPANSVPYETREGGYQYFAGGPYYADEEIQYHFPEATEDVINKALSIIERYGGPEWVRKEDY